MSGPVRAWGLQFPDGRLSLIFNESKEYADASAKIINDYENIGPARVIPVLITPLEDSQHGKE